jgi:hypothetical protein
MLASTTITVEAPKTASASSRPPHNIPNGPALREALNRDGFVLIPRLIPPESVLFKFLLQASQNATMLARRGEWPYVRTLPKQFPPWNADDALNNGIWGVQHLLHPDMPDAKIFAKGYFSDEIMHVVRGILGLDESDEKEAAAEGNDLVMELWNLLVQPAILSDSTSLQGKDFELTWHRDDGIYSLLL